MGGEKIPTKFGKVVFFPHEIMAAAREAEISNQRTKVGLQAVLKGGPKY